MSIQIALVAAARVVLPEGVVVARGLAGSQQVELPLPRGARKAVCNLIVREGIRLLLLSGALEVLAASSSDPEESDEAALCSSAPTSSASDEPTFSLSALSSALSGSTAATSSAALSGSPAAAWPTASAATPAVQ
eukprot:CAMPEP_0204541782 /NCGR_PEP_ID=MMETSP0661-20131031/18487_1 /ASSEMBLY_ACC=CAM_ASM_000606 /TAXON_ID=109239 /ORGANISM="Alexandrium margalefi, Strain AMGDE01CS-322" /LENGTH=134 /DNA_ID=CAMNT_0051548477 /DNA_START=33 /DNA_END=435 /DNA_ORIENTATION=+